MMKFLLCFAVCLGAGGSLRAQNPINDLIYPPAAAAKPAVDMDGRGFIINGERRYLTSGSIHYPRVPGALWRDRLMRLQRAGFNSVESYAFWNFHEATEGRWDFSGDHDLEGFLDTAKELGLYAIMRPGPYVCAEWDFGGWPIWLKFKPEMQLRTNDSQFLTWNDHWYDKILPIIAKHQIHRGGNVILVQLENEHPDGWGIVNNQAYFDHLLAKSKALGIEVPQFFSGLNHSSNPIPQNPDTSARTSPWLVTEFWGGWFDRYGALDASRLKELETTNWAIMARGGAGHNFYMAHGGTNFETWNDASGAASYDYGAPIGQTGDLRPDYFRMKRANQLATSFPKILADGADAVADFSDEASGAGLIGARRSAAGTMLFYQNAGAAAAALNFKDGTSLNMEAGETLAVLKDAVIGEDLKIAATNLRVLGVAVNQTTTTVVVYGQPGESGRLLVGSSQLFISSGANPAFTTTATSAGLSIGVTFPAQGPEELVVDQSGRSLRIVALRRELVPLTWITGRPPLQQVIVGPNYVGEIAEADGKLSSLVIERPYGSSAPGRVVVYGAKGGTRHLAATTNFELEGNPPPTLGSWKSAAAPESAAGFDDSAWRSSRYPQQMGADGDTSAFAWYRNTLIRAAAGPAVLKLQGNDNLQLFVNGVAVPESSRENDRWVFQVQLNAAANSLVVFTSHAGRDKAFNYLGSASTLAPKGLLDARLESNGTTAILQTWRMRGGAGTMAAASMHEGPFAAAPGVPTFHSTSFSGKSSASTGSRNILRVTTAGLTRGTIWLNGHNLGRYPEKLRLNGMYLPECWFVDGPNELKIFDEGGASPAAVGLIEETASSREQILVSREIDAAVPIVLPSQKDFTKLNEGNLAFKKSATASASEAGHPPGDATDGDTDSRWCAPDANPDHWLMVDLGADQPVDFLEIIWENAARFYGYRLEGSADGTVWRTLGDDGTAVAAPADSASPSSRHQLAVTSFRYLKITGNRLAAGNWMSIREVRVSRNAYQQWAFDHRISGAADRLLADDDGDGISNLIEFAFNLDPAAGSTHSYHPVDSPSAGLPRMMPVPTAPGGHRLSLQYLRRKSVAGLKYEAQFGSSLDDFGPVTGESSVEAIDAGWERVTVEDPASVDSARRFGRVRVSFTP